MLLVLNNFIKNLLNTDFDAGFVLVYNALLLRCVFLSSGVMCTGVCMVRHLATLQTILSQPVMLLRAVVVCDLPT